MHLQLLRKHRPNTFRKQSVCHASVGHIYGNVTWWLSVVVCQADVQEFMGLACWFGSTLGSHFPNWQTTHGLPNALPCSLIRVGWQLTPLASVSLGTLVAPTHQALQHIHASIVYFEYISRLMLLTWNHFTKSMSDRRQQLSCTLGLV